MIDNRQKYENYKEQMGRLKKALQYEFYIEAIAIEYAIMEDRLESVLVHEGVFNLKNHGSLIRKLRKVEDLRCRKGSLENKYLSEELLTSISDWSKRRNMIIHALLKQELTTEELIEIANDGNQIVKTLTSKVTSIRRKLEAKK